MIVKFIKKAGEVHYKGKVYGPYYVGDETDLPEDLIAALRQSNFLYVSEGHDKIDEIKNKKKIFIDKFNPKKEQ